MANPPEQNKQIMVDGKAVKVRVCKKKDCGAHLYRGHQQVRNSRG